MTRIAFFLFHIFVLHLFIPINAQVKKRVVRKRNITEEFHAVNREIKHGLYIKTIDFPIGNSFVLEFGNYDKNVRTGQWLTFYGSSTNSLQSIGIFVHGKKEGLWKYYYPFYDSSAQTLGSLLGATRKAALVTIKGWHGEKGLAYDTSGQKCMAKGYYMEDEKIGQWKYFSKNNDLLHVYDYDKHKLLINHLPDSLNRSIIFLGGDERLYMYLFELYLLEYDYQELKTPSTVIYNIEPDQNGMQYVLIKKDGDEKFKALCDSILQSVPRDWVLTQSGNRDKIQLIFQLELVETKDGWRPRFKTKIRDVQE